jgi:hypothetical protein
MFELNGPLNDIHTADEVIRIHCSHGSLSQVDTIGTLAERAQVRDGHQDGRAAVWKRNMSFCPLNRLN